MRSVSSTPNVSRNGTRSASDQASGDLAEMLVPEARGTSGTIAIDSRSPANGSPQAGARLAPLNPPSGSRPAASNGKGSAATAGARTMASDREGDND